MNIINQKRIIYFIILIGIILKVIYLVQFDDYYDDWNFFYTVEPHISNIETWQRHYYGDRGDGILKEAFPWNFTYLTKFFLHYAGYTVENTHYFLLLFSIVSFFFFYSLCKLISKDFNFHILAFILFATNLFLVRELNSFRPHSLSVLLSLISNYLFIIVFINKKINKFTIVGYIISVLLMLSFWPQNLSLFGGHCIFLLLLLFKKEISKKLFFLIPVTILISYVSLNYQYIEYIALQDWSYTPLNVKFFINYFFRSFFGSIVFGGLMLVIFAFFLMNSLKNEIKYFGSRLFLKPNAENFIIINILSIYLLTITYSLIKESVLAPKYFLVLLPLIIIWISLKISESKKKLFSYFVIVCVILNSIYFWSDIPIKRAPMRDVLRIVTEKDIKNIYTTENIVFNNYLSHYNFAIENNIHVSKFSNHNIEKKNDHFVVLCLNYARAAHGDNYKDLIEEKCQNILDNEKLIILEEIRIPDFFIFITKYRNSN